MEPIIPVAIEAYCAAHSSALSALSHELEQYTLKNRTDAQMLVGPLEGAFLQMLVRIILARRILEIGTFTGYSALAMAEALPADGELITCEINAKNAAVAESFIVRSPSARKIKIRLGAALDTLKTLPTNELFDLVFIDADKENYLAYYESVLPLVRVGGVIAVDNVLWSGHVLNPRKPIDHKLVAFNENIRADKRVDCVMLPIRDGVTLVRKK